MPCGNHPDRDAVDHCAGCARAFCADCLVEIHGHKFCAACKAQALHDHPAIAEEATSQSPEAIEALVYAIAGYFCLGIFLGPIAIYKALKAWELIRANPRLAGAGKAVGAMVIGTIGSLLWAVGLVNLLVRHADTLVRIFKQGKP